MFNVQELTEQAGYEYWVLRKCLIAVEKHAGVSSDVTVVFLKDGTKEHFLQMYSHFGSAKQVQVIEDLSPLLFVSSYKMIDMYIEWILNSNGQQVPRRFDQKYRICIDNASMLSLPSEISSDDHNVLLELYDKLRLKRNCIIHGSWGRNQKGDLQFDYTKGEVQDQETIIFKDVINLAELAVLFYDRIHSQQGAEQIETSYRYLSDQLIVLHQSHTFGIVNPRFYEVILEADDKGTVELGPIREYLKKDNTNHNVAYKLTVRTPSKELIFTSKELNGKDSISLK